MILWHGSDWCLSIVVLTTFRSGRKSSAVGFLQIQQTYRSVSAHFNDTKSSHFGLIMAKKAIQFLLGPNDGTLLPWAIHPPNSTSSKRQLRRPVCYRDPEEDDKVVVNPP